MPTGLRVPVGVNKSGGANIESDEPEQTKKMLFLALSEGGDDNPFQNLGLQGDLIFSIQNPAFRGRALKAVERVIARFSDRLVLAPGESIKFEADDTSEITMSFQYVDISTDKVEDFEMKFVR